MSFNYSKRPTSLVEGAFQTQADTLTYEPYFGLTEKPFSLKVDPRFVYDSPTFGATRDALLAGIRRREGLLVLTGEIGTGKTTMCRAVIEDLGRKTYSSLVPDPFASREDLLKMLLIDFGALSIQELTSGSLRQASRTELGYVLSEFLDSLTTDAYVVVMIDEAQNLSLPLIEETRILADTFAADGRLQIIFVGQPELQAKLKSPEMRQVDQRVCGYHRLAPMNREAVAGYIQHRLWVAGRRDGHELFPADVVDAFHQRSGGVPRLINRVGDRALQLAFERRVAAVNREILDTALIEVGAATLSPTWDSIMFAEPAPPASAAKAPAVPAAAAPPPASAEPAAEAVAADAEDNFSRQIENWVEQDLGTPSRTLTSARPGAASTAGAQHSQRPVPKPISKREVPTRNAKAEWPRDLRSELYIHRLLRKWLKWTAIALGVFFALNLGIVAMSLVTEALAPVELPETPVAPAATVPGLELPEPPAANAPLIVSPAAAAETTGNYLVAVGLFASSERADALVDALTRAGLPAMQRSVQLRQQQVQQIVLGPFFTRAEAVADLRRLQQMGGHGDARVIDAAREVPPQ